MWILFLIDRRILHLFIYQQHPTTWRSCSQRTGDEKFPESFPFPAKEVSFASVQVREYPMILGDNPSCTSIPPITLDWIYDVEASMSCTIKWMGKAVGIAPGARRARSESPRWVRTEWVLDAGFTPMQVHERSETCSTYREVKFPRKVLQRCGICETTGGERANGCTKRLVIGPNDT
jgi:hypothetical protein